MDNIEVRCKMTDFAMQVGVTCREGDGNAKGWGIKGDDNDMMKAGLTLANISQVYSRMLMTSKLGV